MEMKASIPISGATKQEKQSKRLAYKWINKDKYATRKKLLELYTCLYTHLYYNI